MNPETNTDQQAAGNELATALAPFMALPVATPAMMLELGLRIFRKMDAVQAAANDSAGKRGAAWMTNTDLAAHFNYERQTMHSILQPYVEAGKVRVIQHRNPRSGGLGNPRYNVADAEAVLLAETAKATRATAKGKGGKA